MLGARFSPARDRLKVLALSLWYSYIGWRRRREDAYESDVEANDASSDDITSISSSNSSASSLPSIQFPAPAHPHQLPAPVEPLPIVSPGRPTTFKLASLPPLQDKLLKPIRSRMAKTSTAAAAEDGLNGAAPPHSFPTLPLELQILVIRHLDFADIQNLRRTSHFYKDLVTKSLLRTVYGDALEAIVLSHCHLCMRRDRTGGARMLYADVTDPRYPFCSRCVDCAVARDLVTPGHRVSMGNFLNTRACRWCGYPVSVMRGDSPRTEQYHDECLARYGSVLLAYFALGMLQLCVVVVGAALNLKYFRQMKSVLVVSIISLMLALCSFILIASRRMENRRTYHLSFLIEFILLGLWIVPTYAIASSIDASPGASVPKSTQATLAFCGLNLLFRLLNALGNAILMSEVKFWKRSIPGQPYLRRLLNFSVAFLIMWTYPMAVHQLYPSPGLSTPFRKLRPASLV